MSTFVPSTHHRKFHISVEDCLAISDEFELSRVEPSWGTLIFEMKPSFFIYTVFDNLSVPSIYSEVLALAMLLKYYGYFGL